MVYTFDISRSISSENFGKHCILFQTTITKKKLFNLNCPIQLQILFRMLSSLPPRANFRLRMRCIQLTSLYEIQFMCNYGFCAAWYMLWFKHGYFWFILAINACVCIYQFLQLRNYGLETNVFNYQLMCSRVHVMKLILRWVCFCAFYVATLLCLVVTL